MVTGSDSLKGNFLMAMPGLRDPNFHQTVTIICEHNDQGALGVVVNRVHPHIFCENIFSELQISFSPSAGAAPVHIGGPVHGGELFVIHGPPFEWESCLEITPNIAMSNTRDIVEAIAAGNGPASFILSLGCAGWGPGQLEMELRENAWLFFPASGSVIFDMPVDTRWEGALKQMGVNPALLIETAGNA